MQLETLLDLLRRYLGAEEHLDASLSEHVHQCEKRDCFWDCGLGRHSCLLVSLQYFPPFGVMEMFSDAEAFINRFLINSPCSFGTFWGI